MIKFANGAAAQLVASFGSHTDAETIFVELYGGKSGVNLAFSKE